MLNQMEKDKDRNQYLLRPHVCAAEAAIQLKDGNLRKMTRASRLGHLEALVAVEWVPPVTIYVQHLLGDVENLDYTVAEGIDNALDMLMPVELQQCEAAPVAWEWEKPSFRGLVSHVAGRYERARLFGDEVDSTAEAAEMEACGLTCRAVDRVSVLGIEFVVGAS